MKKIIASILVIILLLLHIGRYNLEFIGIKSNISMFDLIDDICWIFVIILLILNQKSTFLISMYILLMSGALQCSYKEILGMGEIYTSSDYIFLELGIIIIIIFNLIVYSKSKSVIK